MAARTVPTHQDATIQGRNNTIIQIQGNGNRIDSRFPHLTLTRYLTRRNQVVSELDLLSPYGMTIPLLCREPQMADLHTWLASHKAITIRVLTGRAGSGKTRLALELCEAVLQREWDAGFVTNRELARFTQQHNLSTWGWQRPTLIVIDYAAASARILHDWFVELADHDGDPQRPLRILLLERHADPSGSWWRQAFGRGGGDAQAIRRLLDPPNDPVAVPSLVGAGERSQILQAMLDRVGSTVRLPEPGMDIAFDHQLAQVSWGGEPLFLMMAGLTLAQAGVVHLLALNRRRLVFDMADREINRIEQLAQEWSIAEGFLSHMAAYVTLCQGLERTPLEEAIEEEKDALRRDSVGDAYDIANVLYIALPGERGVVNPILPDIIGEAVTLRALAPLDQDKQKGTVLRAFGRARTQVAAHVIRTVQDYATIEYTTPLDWLDRLMQEGASNPLILIDLANQLPPTTLILRERAAGLYAAILEIIRRFIIFKKDERTQETEPIQEFLGRTLNSLSGCLSNLGRHEEAFTTAQEAVEVYRQLAAVQPDAFLHHLAMVLNTMANCLSDLGRREEAFTTAQEAVGIRRQLASGQPDVFLPQLAMVLNTMANRLSDLGRREEAFTTAQEAVGIYRKFTAVQSDVFLPYLAMALNTQAHCLSDLGRHEEAFTTAQEAVEVYRQLAAVQPDAFLHHLATVLNNLANYSINLGRHEEAFTTAQEAVGIRRQLASGQPDAFLPDLAMALNSQAHCLSNLGRHEEAFTTAQEAVEVYRQLAAVQSNALLPNLAMTLSTQAKCLSNLGRHEEAFTTAQEAVEVYRQLAAVQSNAFSPNLAMVEALLAICLSNLGRREEAFTTAQEAVVLLSSYFLTYPSMFAQEMWFIIMSYLHCAAQLQREPDADLLLPLEKAFHSLQVRIGEASQ